MTITNSSTTASSTDSSTASSATVIGPDHPDAVIYRGAADAFRGGNLEAMVATWSPDLAWHIPGRTWFAREIDGRGKVLEYLGELRERTNGTFVLKDSLVSASDHHVVAEQVFGVEVDGEYREFDVTSVMRFEDGCQAERWFHFRDLDAWDAFVAKL